MQAIPSPVPWLLPPCSSSANLDCVPQLIASGTAVAAATTGFVFGQLADGHLADPESFTKRKSFLATDSTFRPESTQKTGEKRSAPADTAGAEVLPSPLLSSPAQAAVEKRHSSTQPTDPSPPRLPRQSSDTRVTPPRSSSRRPPTTGSRLAAEAGSAEPRDSLSSNGSWLRRIPLRPLSQHGSLRSSVGPDSSSIAFSYASGAPILATPRHQAVVLPPNKLVKRASAANSADPIAVVQLGSRPQLTLRRPATSHQRSATLQQQIDVEALSASLNQASLDCQTRPRAQTLAISQQDCAEGIPTEVPSWKSFWHVRIGRQAPKGSPFRSNEGARVHGTKRVCLEENKPSYVYLVKPKTVMTTTEQPVPLEDTLPQPVTDASPSASNKSSVSPEATPSRAPRRSTSLNFSSPTSWISKTGSIRRRKRGDPAPGGKRAVSGPMDQTTEPALPKEENVALDSSPKDRQTSRAEADLTAIFRPPRSRQGSVSPLPPPSRSSSQRNYRPAELAESPMQVDGLVAANNSVMRIDSRTSQSRSHDRASTVASSEYYRGFTSGDDDDTDIKTDTPFDSFRTMASTSLANKPKRLSIQEILGFPYEDGGRIIEEDESVPTPIRANHTAKQNGVHGALDDLTNDDMDKNFRVSFDDDDDLEWAQEDETHVYTNLSPPSSTNSRRASPSLRMALAAIDGNSPHEGPHGNSGERPRSTVFDWVEQQPHEQHFGESQTLRPKTAYGKKDRDIRGGRSASRKAPTAAHIRSQSVPVVQDQPEATKPTPRFGTWGLGSKNVSEDWDADFEFDEAIPEDPAETAQTNRLSMVVPPSIQATQHTLKAHSGQIRELSLLVNDLKRLCRLGREMQMMNGTSKLLWLEAEDVIALASPDEDEESELADGPTKDEENNRHDRQSIITDERFTAQGFDGSSLDATHNQPNHAGRQVGHEGAHPTARRRSVFSPEDDIFGTWDHLAEPDSRPRTPENRSSIPKPSTATKAVIEAMRARTKQRVPDAQVGADSELSSRLNFDTNSLKDLVKRASELRDALSDLVRAADCIAPSPARTPRRSDRPDGSPAFTRVFDEPNPSPSRRPPLPHASTTSSFNSSSLSTSPTSGLSQRLHMMTVG
ncbi:uncharacterized protein B0I36DRAFT_344068 [Microdochium trichocladiopsis]|uniref:Uncharacterized protein n=1 Tax=Microdochium trichocladiopsis TaxID=1682393 RepID=A0A9P9BW07_9PEZI|nr:uncharacterized protein B0I36DRAFT_344068 [Microdochium trichocladiopsis]KAH7040302.1 hypothetical protein B0I36DRAFT_344068 [Microdochium trichocladiopsis]